MADDFGDDAGKKIFDWALRLGMEEYRRGGVSAGQRAVEQAIGRLEAALEGARGADGAPPDAPARLQDGGRPGGGIGLRPACLGRPATRSGTRARAGAEPRGDEVEVSVRAEGAAIAAGVFCQRDLSRGAGAGVPGTPAPTLNCLPFLGLQFPCPKNGRQFVGLCGGRFAVARARCEAKSRGPNQNQDKPKPRLELPRPELPQPELPRLELPKTGPSEPGARTRLPPRSPDAA